MEESLQIAPVAVVPGLGVLLSLLPPYAEAAPVFQPALTLPELEFEEELLFLLPELLEALELLELEFEFVLAVWLRSVFVFQFELG